jgi:hypothetical protein
VQTMGSANSPRFEPREGSFDCARDKWATLKPKSRPQALRIGHPPRTVNYRRGDVLQIRHVSLQRSTVRSESTAFDAASRGTGDSQIGGAGTMSLDRIDNPT